MRFASTILLISFAALGSAEESAAPAFEEQARRFEQAITAMSKVDQKHPDFLNANLDYAQLLARAADGDCATRLATAQTLYDTVRNNPISELVLTAGAGKIPFTGYLLEMARYRCETDAARKPPALENARKLARAAVDGYRSLFMYDSMAVMQFNVAQSYLEAGDKAQAAKELEAAIEMDRTFGLRNDAEDNFRALRDWSGAKATDEEVAKFLAGFAPRSATLTFGWKPFSLRGTATYDLATYEGRDVRHTKFTLPITGALRADKDLFVYELRGGDPQLDPAIQERIEKRMVGLMARLIARSPPAEITAAGEFKGVRDVDTLTKAMTKDIDDTVAATVTADDPRLPGIKETVDSALRPYTKPESLLARLQEDFALETGIWIGATLEQGKWMEMPLIVSLNGTPQGFVQQHVQFQLARWLPCGATAPRKSCVELLLDARPRAEAIQEIATKMAANDQGRFDYAGSTRRRIVVDPATLLVYESETLKYSYLAITHDKRRVVKIGADRTTFTRHYGK